MNLEYNIETLKALKELKNNWNGGDSEPIPHKFIDIALDHISKLLIQPKVTPYDNGICFEWATGSDNLIQVNISDNIEYIVSIEQDLVYDQIIESKFIGQYVNRILKQELKNTPY